MGFKSPPPIFNPYEEISKPQIRFEGEASQALEAERTPKYGSSSMRGATKPLNLGWDFETTSNAPCKVLTT